MEPVASGASALALIAISIGMTALFFLVFRRFVLWYFKLDRLDSIAEALKVIAAQGAERKRESPE